MTIIEKLSAASRAVAAQASDLLMVCGALGISYGISLIYLPAGVIAQGVFTLVAGVMLARGSK